MYVGTCHVHAMGLQYFLWCMHVSSIIWQTSQCKESNPFLPSSSPDRSSSIIIDPGQQKIVACNMEPIEFIDDSVWGMPFLFPHINPYQMTYDEWRLIERLLLIPHDNNNIIKYIINLILIKHKQSSSPSASVFGFW